MAAIIGYPKFRATRASGLPGNGWKLYSYSSGSSTPKATYTAQDGLTANPNPLVLDGAGEGSVWLSGSYKLVLTDENDVVQWTLDAVGAPDAGEFTTLTVTGAAAFATISASGQITSLVAAGVAPFVIPVGAAKVPNLDADKLDGGDWVAPGAIGATTPGTGKFTTLQATSTATLDAGLVNKANALMDTPNGGSWQHRQISEEITLSVVGTTSDSVTDLLPANSIIEAVVARVTQTITTATDWKLGDATQAARFLAAQSGAQLSIGATAVGFAHAQPTVASNDLGPVQTAAAKLRVTCTGTAGSGKIRCTVFYRQFVAPTS